MKSIGFLDKRKQAGMQWVQDLSQSNVDNVNSVRREASRHSRNKKKEYLQSKIDELETNSKLKYTEACIGAPFTLRRVPSLELIKQR